MKKLSDLHVGEKAELKHKINKEDLEKFVALTGDDNKLHTDGDFAQKTPLKTTVVHGMLGASFISTIIGTKLPGDGALWFSQNLDFLLPVRIGDEITVTAEIMKKFERDGVIEIKTDIYNQYREKVTAGTAKVKLLEIEESTEIDTRNPAKEKVALVIGATGGIGKATCHQLANDGFDIIIHYHSNEQTAKQIKEKVESIGRKAIIVNGDITSDDQMNEMFQTIERFFQSITIMVNCSTIKFANISFSKLKWDDIKNHIELNVKGSYNVLKYVIPIMEKVNYGKIIMITTQYIETPCSNLTHYITAKGALHSFSKSLAIELAPKGIRINMVSPGMTETELIANVPEKIRMLTATKTPLRRLAYPEDVANVISFLASSRSDYLTGETIRVNGGQVML